MANRTFSARWVAFAAALLFFSMKLSAVPPNPSIAGTAFGTTVSFTATYMGGYYANFGTIKPSWYTEYGDGTYSKNWVADFPKTHVYANAGSFPVTAYAHKKNVNAPPAKMNTNTSVTSSIPAAALTNVAGIDQSWRVSPGEQTIFPITLANPGTYSLLLAGVSFVSAHRYVETMPGVWKADTITGGSFTTTGYLNTVFVRAKCPGGLNAPTSFSVKVINNDHAVVASLTGSVFSSPYDPNGKWADIDLLTEASQPTVITYQIGFENIGNGTAKDVVISDNFSDGHLIASSIVWTVAPPACSTAMNSTSSTAYDFEMWGLNLAPDSSDHIEVQVNAHKFMAGEIIKNTASIVFFGMDGSEMLPIETNTSTIPIISCENFSRFSLSRLRLLSDDAILAQLENGGISIGFLYFAHQNGVVSEDQLHDLLAQLYTAHCDACGCCSISFDEFWEFFLTGSVPLPTLWAFALDGGLTMETFTTLSEEGDIQWPAWKKMFVLMNDCFGEENEERVAEKAVFAEKTSSLAPNPTDGRTEIRFSIAEKSGAPVSISLANLSGQLVAEPFQNRHFAAGDHAESIDLGQLPTGIYLLRLKTDHEARTFKLLKY